MGHKLSRDLPTPSPCKDCRNKASAYTQTSDVEQVLNGLLTYDRKVSKEAWPFFSN